MKTNLTIKNFRIFDEDGATLELNPITILTGCNSSGKSSIVKAIFLLDSFLKQIKKDIDNNDHIRLSEYKLDFSTYPNTLLGRFDKVINSGSSSTSVTMEYTVYSLMLSKDVTIKLRFKADKNDKLNNAHLESIFMSTDDGTFFSSSKENGGIFGGNYRNYNIIKNECLDFLQIEYLIHGYCGIESAFEPYGNISKEEHDSEQEIVVSELKKFNRNRVKDVVNHVYYAKNGFGDIINKNKADYNIIEWTKTNNSFFRVPIIDKLNTIHKKQLWEYIEYNILKCDPNDLVSIASKKIIDDYIISNEKSFGEYFKKYEVLFFDGKGKHDRFGMLSSSPNLNPDLGLNQQYLMYDPRESFFIRIGERNKEEERKKEFETWKAASIDFDMIYELVMLWNSKAGYDQFDDNKFYYRSDDSLVPNISYNHEILSCLSCFVRELLIELVTPEWCGLMDYVGSSRVSVNRLYSMDDDTNFTQLLRKYFENKRMFLGDANRRKYKADSFLNKWTRNFKLGKRISFNVDKDGLGVTIKLHKYNDKKGSLLSDEGYGVTQLMSILLQIENAILAAKKTKRNHHIGIDSFDNLIDHSNDYEAITIAIEEPEIHLHPQLQSLLADMLLEAYQKYNIHFIIETHSEYLIRKSQVLVAKMKFKTNQESDSYSPFKTYYIPQKGKPYSLGYRKDGKFAESFGKGFYDEAANLSYDIL